jgi:hypothetical protein
LSEEVGVDEMRENIRLANIILAITTPIFAIAAILLRHAGEGVLQVLGLIYFFSVIGILIAFFERDERRRKRGQ